MGGYIAEIVGFIIIIAVVVKWVVPPVRKMANSQQDAIRAQLEEAERAKERLAGAKAEYERAIADAEREGEKMKAEAREQGEAIRVDMRRQSEEDARRIVEQARQQIDADHRLAVVRLQSQVGRLSAELAGRLVRTTMRDDAAQHRVIDRFIDQLDGMASPADARKERVASS